MGQVCSWEVPRYQALGLTVRPGDESPSRTEVERAYRRRARQLHPDRGGRTTDFQELQAAYEYLHAKPQHNTEPERHIDPAAAKDIIERMMTEDAEKETVPEEVSFVDVEKATVPEESSFVDVEKATVPEESSFVDAEAAEDGKKATVPKETAFVEGDKETVPEETDFVDAEAAEGAEEGTLPKETTSVEAEKESLHDNAMMNRFDIIRDVMNKRGLKWAQAQKVVKEEGLYKAKASKAASKGSTSTPASEPATPSTSGTSTASTGLKVSDLLQGVLDGSDIPLDTPKPLVEHESQLLAKKLSQAKRAKRVNEETVKTFTTWSELFLAKKAKYLRSLGKHIQADTDDALAAKRQKFKYHEEQAAYHQAKMGEVFEGAAGIATSTAETAQAFADAL